MTRAIRSWRQSRRYQNMVRELRSLSPRELNALGISPEQIPHLASQVSGL